MIDAVKSLANKSQVDNALDLAEENREKTNKKSGV